MSAAPAAGAELLDKYVRISGDVYITGTQTLVALCLVQRRLDRRDGLNTAGFVSGYRGSPVGGVDVEFWNAEALLAAENVHFFPGVNEEIAAAAVWGSQMLELESDRTVDGVFGLWYGKGAGLDRCGDVMRHAHGAGSSRLGGVLVAVGDDHALKSSSQAYHSEPTFADLQMPVLYPSNIQEVLDFGILGWAMSRYSGCWTGLKLLPETLNSTECIDIDLRRHSVLLPRDQDGPADRHIRWPDPWASVEKRLIRSKLPAALSFARLNRLNREIVSAPIRRLGIVTAGKSCGDVIEALRMLGLDRDSAAGAGISVFKVGMPWPLEPAGTLDFVRGHERVLVVEEKRNTIELQIKDFLHDFGERWIRVVGRRDTDGNELFGNVGENSVEQIANAVLHCSPGLEGVTQRRLRRAREHRLRLQAPVTTRQAYFCSGCPHNTSTRVPEGSKALGGVGCHYLAVTMDRDTTTFTNMGNEGVPWIGMSRFLQQRHRFVNLGEGTYYHSGLLAIRACVAANVDITFKLLFNDAVAMTGGQPVDGPLTVPQLTHQLRAEGISTVVLVSDEPHKYPKSSLAPGVSVHRRTELDEVQRRLREISGVTALIYDQTCATEKRRRRKRGKAAESMRRVAVNAAVCEGCGDCGMASNCLSVQPLETELGRKRVIDQYSCNQDFSCIEGFCPSFVTLEGARLRRPTLDDAALEMDRLPEPVVPALPDGASYDILVAGVGGTGIVTIGAILSMAAHLQGYRYRVHDKLGMAQKFGAVTSHVRIAAGNVEIPSVRIPAASARLILAADLVEATSPDNLALGHPDRCVVVANENVSMTGEFARNPDYQLHEAEMKQRIVNAFGGRLSSIPATELAVALAGDVIGSNMLMLGFAWQAGLIPLARDSIERAIAVNGNRVDWNLRVFSLGRQCAANPALIDRLQRKHGQQEPVTIASFDDRLAYRYDFLVAYQDKAYADRFRALVADAVRTDQVLTGDRGRLSVVVMESWFKLLSYKDEYEVARLFSDGSFQRQLDAQFEGNYRLTYHLAPPALSVRRSRDVPARKIAVGAWIRPVFSLLASMKRLRGTPLDPFGWTAERRTERRLIEEYETLVRSLLETLTPENYDVAVDLASIPRSIRGFGHVKARSIRAAALRAEVLRKRFREIHA